MRDLNELRDKLMSEREEIQSRIAHVQKGEQRETADHQTDNAHEWENSEIRDGVQVEAQDELKKIDHALQRLDQGSYGICSKCGQPIADARLEALPYADLCIDCAEAAS